MLVVMEPQIRPVPEMPVARALAVWPQLTGVFVRRGMACPGCAMGELMTLGEAAEVYGLTTAAFIEELCAAV
jgi:hybrid cluster-associated redox disulfide protein